MQKQSDWKSKICRIVIEKLIGLNYNDEEENVLSEDDLEVTNLQSDELNSFLIENEIKCFDDVIYERRDRELCGSLCWEG